MTSVIGIKLTNDGSHTLYNESLDEHYHSVNGAIAESEQVYIVNGLRYVNKEKLSVLEIGFGTGLNAFLSVIEAERSERQIIYTGIEAFPLPETFYSQLNYPKYVEEEYQQYYEAICQSAWDIRKEITAHFSLLKLKADVLSCTLPSNYDIVFFDAFAPEKQPELWTEKLFQKLVEKMNPSAVLCTYCSKGIVKQSLRKLGLKVERLPGPPGKRHVLRAVKT